MNASDLKEKKVSDFMTFYPDAVKSTDNLLKAKIMMEEGAFHHIPVIDEELNVIGMITQSDINLLMDWTYKNLVNNGSTEVDVKSGILLKSMLAKEYCSKNIISVKASDNIMRVVELFRENRFHCLPVLDDSERLIGIITTYDLMIAAFR